MDTDVMVRQLGEMQNFMTRAKPMLEEYEKAHPREEQPRDPNAEPTPGQITQGAPNLPPQASQPAEVGPSALGPEPPKEGSEAARQFAEREAAKAKMEAERETGGPGVIGRVPGGPEPSGAESSSRPRRER